MSAPAATKVSRRDIDDPKEKENQHLHSEILHDGTIIKRYKKRGILSDGSLIIKSVEKATPPSTDLNSDSLPTDHVIKKIRTITQQIYPDGISHVTTKASRLIKEVEREECTSDLPDGPKLISSKETKALPGGNYLSTISTTVHVSRVESLRSGERKQPQNETAFVGNQVHNVILKGTTLNDADVNSERSQNTSLKIFDGPNPCEEKAEECEAKSDSSINKHLETIEDSDAPVPIDHVASSPSAGVGAHFISLPELVFVDKELKLNSKEASLRQNKSHVLESSYKRTLEVIESFNEPDCCPVDLYDDQEAKAKSKPPRKFLETLENPGEPTPPEYIGQFCDKKDRMSQDHESPTPFSYVRNFKQRLFKVAPDTEQDPSEQLQQSQMFSNEHNSRPVGRQFHNVIEEGHSLVVATRVDSSLDEPIYEATDYDPKCNQPHTRQNPRWRIYSVMSLLLFTITIVLVAVYSTKEDESAVVQKPGIDVTVVPTPSPITDREALGISYYIEANVLQDYAKFSAMNKGDPRMLALEWILHTDEMQIGPTDPNLYQRYVLALLAFQFDSLAWTWCGGDYFDAEKTCSVEINGTDTHEEHMRWLSGTDECDWYGVFCSSGKVRELKLRESISTF
jgi:hypothetical protein